MPKYNVTISLDADSVAAARKQAQGWDLGGGRIEMIIGPPEVQHFLEGVPSNTPALAETIAPLPPNEQEPAPPPDPPPDPSA